MMKGLFRNLRAFGRSAVRTEGSEFRGSGPRTSATTSNPKGRMYCYGGILPYVLIVIPNMETLHSTISVHRTLWVIDILHKSRCSRVVLGPGRISAASCH